jgi:uncharacterized protein with ParB-like and HNH nuclease domain
MDQFLTPEEWNIDNLFKGKYLIPIYQRPYSWGENEVKQLLKDIYSSYQLFIASQNGDTSVKNEEMLLFAGTLFIKTNKNVKNEYTEYDIVDGQQRTTTLTLVLMVLLNTIIKIDSDDDAVKEIKNYLWKKVDRKNNKDVRVLTLGNIDQSIMIELFDNLFSGKDIVEFAKNKLNETLNDIEENLLNNVVIISNFFNKFEDKNEYYNYFDYIKSNIRFIAIKVQTNLVKLFSIFESINSKGKPLEDIDLIKSYIFQNINESDYDEYLTKWGNLIIETNDHLMDYLIVYVRANVSYYRNNIKLDNFKSLVKSNFAEYYSTNTLQKTLLAFIDDMLKNVKYYKMISDVNILESEGLSKKALAIFGMNNIADYSHTKALYFKLLNMRDHNGLPEQEFEKILEYAFRFILTFQSICSRESKQTLSVFVDVQNEIYKVLSKCDNNTDLSKKTFNNIINIFNKKISENSINDETLKNGIKTTITYKRNKNVAKVLLSYLEYCSEQSVDYTKLYWILKLGKDIHLDHILPQNPNRNDENFKYYIAENVAILKDGQDFVENAVSNVINKEDFYDEFLHVIGNLRLSWSSDNIKKSNNFVVIKEFDDSFNTNSQIKQRTNDIIKRIINSKLLLSTNDIGDTSNFLVGETSSVIGFRDDEKIFKNYNPISFELLGESYTLGKYTYSELLDKVIVLLYDLNKKEFKELAIEKFKPMDSDRVYISTEMSEIRKPFILDNDVFVEKNLSSNYIVKFLYILLKQLGLDEQDLKIEIKEK